jgi:hypothetical protein
MMRSSSFDWVAQVRLVRLTESVAARALDCGKIRGLSRYLAYLTRGT